MPENSSNKWTPEEDARLKSLIEANTSIHLIAAKLKRSVGAVRTREHTAHNEETGTGRAECEKVSVPNHQCSKGGTGAVLRATWNNASSNRLPDEGFNPTQGMLDLDAVFSQATDSFWEFSLPNFSQWLRSQA